MQPLEEEKLSGNGLILFQNCARASDNRDQFIIIIFIYYRWSHGYVPSEISWLLRMFHKENAIVVVIEDKGHTAVWLTYKSSQVYIMENIVTFSQSFANKINK